MTNILPRAPPRVNPKYKQTQFKQIVKEWRSGEIGKRRGLENLRLQPCGFESHLRHHNDYNIAA